MVVGAIGGRTEVAIIGSGPGGYVAALRAAEAGREVTLIEAAQIGGTCLNVGCIPSKVLIETASLNGRAASAASRGLTGELSFDMAIAAKHIAGVSTRLRNGVSSLLAAAGVTVISGTAHFARYDRLSIESDGQVTHLDFDNAIIATGSRPIELADMPFSDRVVDSTGALALSALPDRIAIVGGGYIGVELGTAFSKLGASVTLVEAADSILPQVPAPIRRPVERRLRQLGVTVRTGLRACGLDGVSLRVGAAGPGQADPIDAATVDTDLVVVAVGRRANGDTCSADMAGVQVGPDGMINVDDNLLAARNIYAIGDVIAGPALAHRASHDAARVVAHMTGLAHPGPATIPAVIFSDPEIVLAGESIAAADERGFAVSKFPHRANARAQTVEATSGATWLVSDASGTIVGMHVVGPHASELVGQAVLAIEMAATVEDLSLSVHAHPTLSESIAEAAWLARGTPLHIHS